MEDVNEFWFLELMNFIIKYLFNVPVLLKQVIITELTAFYFIGNWEF